MEFQCGWKYKNCTVKLLKELGKPTESIGLDFVLFVTTVGLLLDDLYACVFHPCIGMRRLIVLIF